MDMAGGLMPQAVAVEAVLTTRDINIVRYGREKFI